MYLVFPTCFGLLSHHHGYNVRPQNSVNMDTEKMNACIHYLLEPICEQLFISIRFLWILTEQYIPYMWRCFLSLTAVTILIFLAALGILHLFALLTVFFIAIKICKPWGPYSTKKWYTWRWPWRLKHVGVIKYIGDTWISTSLVVPLDNLAKMCRFNYFINPIITTKQWLSSFQQSHCHYNQLPGSRNQSFIIAHTNICQCGPSWDSSPPS